MIIHDLGMWPPKNGCPNLAKRPVSNVLVLRSICLFLLFFLLFLASFPRVVYLMVFHWSLSDRKSHQVSWTLLGVVVVILNNAVFVLSQLVSWFFEFSSLLTKPFRSVPSAIIAICLAFTFMFHIFSVLWKDPSTCPYFWFIIIIIIWDLVWAKGSSGVLSETASWLGHHWLQMTQKLLRASAYIIS